MVLFLQLLTGALVVANGVIIAGLDYFTDGKPAARRKLRFWLVGISIAMLGSGSAAVITADKASAHDHDEIVGLLKPFSDEAKRRFPNERLDDALKKLGSDVEVVKERTQPRMLVQEVAAGMAGVLASVPNKPTRTELLYMSGDAESDQLATQMSAVLEQAGWHPQLVGTMNGNLLPGVNIGGNAGDEGVVQALGHALANGGITCFSKTTAESPAGLVSISVGTKPFVR